MATTTETVTEFLRARFRSAIRGELDLDAPIVLEQYRGLFRSLSTFQNSGVPFSPDWKIALQAQRTEIDARIVSRKTLDAFL